MTKTLTHLVSKTLVILLMLEISCPTKHFQDVKTMDQASQQHPHTRLHSRKYSNEFNVDSMRERPIQDSYDDLASKDVESPSIQSDVNSNDADLKSIQSDIISKDIESPTVQSDLVSKDADSPSNQSDTVSEDIESSTIQSDLVSEDAVSPSIKSDMDSQEDEYEFSELQDQLDSAVSTMIQEALYSDTETQSTVHESVDEGLTQNIHQKSPKQRSIPVIYTNRMNQRDSYIPVIQELTEDSVHTIKESVSYSSMADESMNSETTTKSIITNAHEIKEGLTIQSSSTASIERAVRDRSPIGVHRLLRKLPEMPKKKKFIIKKNNTKIEKKEWISAVKVDSQDNSEFTPRKLNYKHEGFQTEKSETDPEIGKPDIFILSY